MIIQEALSTVKGVVRGAIKIIEEKSYRARYQESFGKDPFKCTHCGEEMVLWAIYHPRYGIIYDEDKAIESGTYKQREEGSNRDECDRRTVWPATAALQLPLFGV